MQFKARNEMANMQVAQEQEQIEWISRSARVLNVSPPASAAPCGIVIQLWSLACHLLIRDPAWLWCCRLLKCVMTVTSAAVMTPPHKEAADVICWYS